MRVHKTIIKLGKRDREELGILYISMKNLLICLQKKIARYKAGWIWGFREKVSSKEWIPDFGPSKMNYFNGATIVGCRDFLIAHT